MTNYNVTKEMKEKIILTELIEKLPKFCSLFFVAKESTSTSLTLIGYARDLNLFFLYLTQNNFKFYKKEIRDITLDDLKEITSQDVESYLSYVSAYKSSGKILLNKDCAKKRKLSSIRSFFKYYYNTNMLPNDVAAKVANPKIRSKEIVRLEVDEVVSFLNIVDKNLTPETHEQKYNQNTYERDRAILTLFLGTGIRVSELVGIDINDIDFHNMSFRVTRKGGSSTILYFSDEVGDALREYIKVRIADKRILPAESALFVSTQRTRISVRAVQLLVKKYAKIAVPLKKISPHKLRSTFGTNLYHETGDIYVVAEVLGHRDVNTTKKHYAAMSDDIKRRAAGKVILRDAPSARSELLDKIPDFNAKNIVTHSDNKDEN